MKPRWIKASSSRMTVQHSVSRPAGNVETSSPPSKAGSAPQEIGGVFLALKPKKLFNSGEKRIALLIALN